MTISPLALLRHTPVERAVSTIGFPSASNRIGELGLLVVCW